MTLPSPSRQILRPLPPVRGKQSIQLHAPIPIHRVRPFRHPRVPVHRKRHQPQPLTFSKEAFSRDMFSPDRFNLIPFIAYSSAP